ncbi:magnesium transporter CorA family protein [Rhodobacter sp. KR11]|uniref:magnesium transporter CorA family protein n=1 Tax=Rhodobacter sp. KR11 TaxID=2974588 RepID=UPI0022233CE6|nr:magnesium transporter CorA family protein [Rhodobacter sp. KR11]MCW1919559.1 magnesium transporter CorA family protein [Rhodobacter sp. KR11]
MLFAFHPTADNLGPCTPDQALWIDLAKPEPTEAALVAPFVPEVPTLADLEEIEISARLYREDGFDIMTILVPGLSRDDMITPINGPVAFLLGRGKLVTVRYHTPRPFETYPARAGKTGLGCETPERIFLGLCEEIIGRIADLLEGAGRELDKITRSLFAPNTAHSPAQLEDALEVAGRQSDMVANCRLSLLTLDRALGFFRLGLEDRAQAEPYKSTIIGLSRDVQALEVHGDYLTARVAQATDATLGMINLAQNTTVRIVSVVAVLFMPPTLIASVYGMNFRLMPELDLWFGYPMALVMMLASALITLGFFKWKKWL